MEGLQELIGRDASCLAVSERIRAFAEELEPAVVGAHQINCSDESEREVVEAFHTAVVRPLLPKLKYWAQSSFRTVNLGCRYEPGSIGIAEHHYATEAAKEGFKLLIVKMNSHVSVTRKDGEVVFGRKNRYDKESVYCGALHALLGGADTAFTRELHDTFSMHETDRVAFLTTKCGVHERALYAAICNATLQGERALADIMTTESLTLTCYLLISAVTINRESADTDLITGLHFIDERSGERKHEYDGLGSDPSRYSWTKEGKQLIVTET